MERLPAEMLSTVVSHLHSAKDLRSVCLVSKAFLSIATAHLFARCQLIIKLSDPDEGLRTFMGQLDYFQRGRQPTLGQLRHFSLKIVSLEILYCHTFVDERSPEIPTPYVVDDLVPLVSQMSNLKTMSLHLGSDSTSGNPYYYLALLVLAEALVGRLKHLEELEMTLFCMSEVWVLLRPLDFSSPNLHVRLRKLSLTTKYVSKTIFSNLWDFIWACPNLVDLRLKLTYCSPLCPLRGYEPILPLKLHPVHPGLRRLHLEQVKVHGSDLIEILGSSLIELTLKLVGMSTKDEWRELWSKLLTGCPHLTNLHLFLTGSYETNEPQSGMAGAFAPDGLRPLVEAVRARQGYADICPELRSPELRSPELRSPELRSPELRSPESV